MPPNFEDIPFDWTTGLATYNGQTYTYRELQQELLKEYKDLQDGWDELRDKTSDIQNLWGTKADRFTDNWYGRKRPYPSQKGKYPSETDEWTGEL